MKRLVISGGEPFLNYETLYKMVKFARNTFGKFLFIRISSNGKYFYDTDQHIKEELLKMDKYGIDEIMISIDKYHFKAGIEEIRLIRIKEIALALGVNIKVSFLDIGKGVPVGEFHEQKEELISKRGCLNRPLNIFSPYLFTNTNGNIYLCSFRLTKPLGNLFFDSWSVIAKNIETQYSYLSGNVLAEIVRQEVDSNKIYEAYQKYGECYLCENHEKIS